jgi:hypothetical protein
MTRTDFKGITIKYFITLSLLCSFIVLASCKEKVAQTASTSYKQQTTANTSAYPGKPLAPVRISYQLSKDIQLGVPLVVTLSITPMVDAQHLSLHYKTEGALTSGDPQPQFDFGVTPAGTVLQQNITVIPQAEGQHRVIVSVRIDSQVGHAGSRSMSIPIVVGNPPQTTLKPQGTMATDPQGRPIIVTPAQQEIIKH